MVGCLEVASLVAVISMHSVRVYHEIELLAFLVQRIQQLQGVLMVDIVISGAMCNLQHYRFCPDSVISHRIILHIIQHLSN